MSRIEDLEEQIKNIQKEIEEIKRDRSNRLLPYDRIIFTCDAFPNLALTDMHGILTVVDLNKSDVYSIDHSEVTTDFLYNCIRHFRNSDDGQPD